jgi:hypothetical protein
MLSFGVSVDIVYHKKGVCGTVYEVSITKSYIRNEETCAEL